MAKFVVKSFPRMMALLCFALVFCSCKRWHYTRKIAPINPTKKYTFTVLGVECKQCVLSVLKTLESVKGLKHVACHCSNKKYEQAYYTCAVSAHAPLAIDVIARKLERDDFSLSSIGGSFDGALSFDNNHKVVFIPDSSAVSYRVQASEHILAEVCERANIKPRVRLSGILKKDTKTFVITDHV